MTAQLTPAQIEKVCDALPTAGNSAWSATQKVIARRKVIARVLGGPDATATATIVSPVRIIGPGDKHVGNLVRMDPPTYTPHGGCSYWHIRQMERAGWEQTVEMIGDEEPA